MDLAGIHATFRGWTAGLAGQNLAARFTHGLEPAGEKLIVSAVLLTARPDPQRRAHSRRPSSERPLARVRYLMAVSGPDKAEVEQALLHLLAAADREPGMELLSADLPPSWWLAQGIPPRPAFQLEACLTEHVQRPVLTAVRSHRLDLTGLTAIRGRVLTSNDTPVPGAEIELLATGRVVRSDQRGEFRLCVADAGRGDRSRWVRVQAGGVEQRFPIPETVTEHQPWLLRMEPPGE